MVRKVYTHLRRIRRRIRRARVSTLFPAPEQQPVLTQTRRSRKPQGNIGATSAVVCKEDRVSTASVHRRPFSVKLSMIAKIVYEVVVVHRRKLLIFSKWQIHTMVLRSERRAQSYQLSLDWGWASHIIPVVDSSLDLISFVTSLTAPWFSPDINVESESR